MPRYSIVYSDGIAGAPLDWRNTLDLIRERRSPDDGYRRRGIVPVRVEHAS